jgi:hypothetical protein
MKRKSNDLMKKVPEITIRIAGVDDSDDDDSVILSYFL